MPCADLYAPDLRARGYRLTPQRKAILHTLHHAGTHLSPTEIFDSAKKTFPRLTEPTVYRTLEFLAANGIAHPLLKGNRRLVYQITRSDHHHHLICRVCGREAEVDHKLLAKLYQDLETSSGYQLNHSHVSFFGLCPTCQKGR